MPTRKPPKGKRVHSLSKNIAKGVQNAGQSGLHLEIVPRGGEMSV